MSGKNMTSTADCVLAVLCAFDGSIDMQDLFDCMLAWGLPGARHDRISEAVWRLIEIGAVERAPNLAAAATPAGRMACQGDILPEPFRFVYINHRGETREQAVLPVLVYHISTPEHPGRQWLMKALDVEKRAFRLFAMKDIKEICRG